MTQALYIQGDKLEKLVPAICTRHQNQKAQTPPFSTTSVQGTDEPHAHVVKQHATPALRKGTRGNMLFDPTERNVNPFLIPTGARAMTELILALTIHDKDGTMAKTAQVRFIIRAGLVLPFEECRAAETH